MRKVMALESQPAVLALYWWSPWHHKFFQSSQDEMDVVARRAFPARGGLGGTGYVQQTNDRSRTPDYI